MKHKAIVRRGTQCALEHLHEGIAGIGELIVAPEKVSICGTDIQILRGLRDDPAPVVGHEGLVKVVEVGEGAVGFAVGDRVTINPTHPSDPDFLLGHNINGLLQQRVRIPRTAVSGGLVSHVSPCIPAARGTLIEPLAVVTYALECLRLEDPDSLLIVGDGLIGNLAAIAAPRVLGEQVSIGMVHRSELGREWTQAHEPRVTNGRTVAELEPVLGKRIAMLSATHRAGTALGLTEAARTLGTRVVAAHLVGGLAPGLSARNSLVSIYTACAPRTRVALGPRRASASPVQSVQQSSLETVVCPIGDWKRQRSCLKNLILAIGLIA